MITSAIVGSVLVSAMGFTFPTADPPPPDTVAIREWQVPWAQSRPRDPFVGPDGTVWFVGQRGNYVASLDPASGEFRKIDLPERALPHNVVVGPDGMLWYAGNGDSHIGRIDPKTATIRRFDMPDAAARDPHTLAFGPTGDLWFTVQGGNFIGRMDPETGEIRLVKSPIERSVPYGIVVDETNRPWVVLFGTNHVASVDPETMRLKEYALPDGARPRRIARTSDGAIWYVDYAQGRLGRLDPASGAVREWPSPGGAESQPYAMTVDDQDRIWYVESGVEPNTMVGFDPRSGEFLGSTTIPSGGGTVRHMVYHGPTRSIWFGTDTNTIGRAVIP